MPSESYPAKTARALIQTALVTEPTRAALTTRLNEEDDVESSTPRFFKQDEFATLRTVCARLIPHAAAGRIAIAARIDERLADGASNGWRYDVMPIDGDAYKAGLAGLNEAAHESHGVAFAALDHLQQDEILRLAQNKRATGANWEKVSPTRFFEELLTEATEIFYSHPRAQDEIGYAGYADARGWRRIGLNELEPWEKGDVKSIADDAALASIAATRVMVKLTDDISPDDSATHAMRTFSTSDIVDAVVIGTGAGGAPLLARLAVAGLRVVALEAGRFWNPARDFATDERTQNKLFWNDERLSAGDDPIAFGNNNSGTGVGGSTLHFTAHTPRAQADDFRLFTEFGVGRDWCLAYSDLAPYYYELENFLGVSGPTSYPWGDQSNRAYPLPPLPLNGAAQLMRRGCDALSIRTSPAPNAALSASYYQPGVGRRAACTNRGFCQAGCSTGAKASMDVTYIPLAIRSGAEVRSECFVTNFERDAGKRLTGVVYTRDGAEQRQLCRHVFLCGGAIETPRLLLINDLANSSGQVGRNFMAHTGVQVWGRFDEEVRPYKGIPGALISEDTHRPQKKFKADFAGGYLLQSIGVMPVTYASQVARGRMLWGERLQTHMREYNRTAGINILGECLPSEKNYLELSAEPDARGLPKPRIHFTNGENERSLTKHAEALMRDIWTAAGAREMWTFNRNAHIIGTCRMGAEARDSVVNSEGRVFDVPNLYISDNSIFPSALAVNPALTIMALSLRIADRFLERARRSEA